MGRGPRGFWSVGHAVWLLDLDAGDMGVSLLCEMSPGCTVMTCALFLYILLQVQIYLQKSLRLLYGE